MATDILALGQAYLTAWDRKDVSAIAEFLHPDVHFLGPMNDLSGKDALLQSTQRILPLLERVKVRAGFVSGDQALFVYDFVCPPPINVCRTAELMTFANGLITRIELFYDARPFEALMRSRQGSPVAA